MKRLLCFVLLLFLTACMPTPQKVNEAIGRGQLTLAVDMMVKILNNNGHISARKLDRLLQALAISHHFDLDIADDLFDKLKPSAKQEILRWYIARYLEAAEECISNDDPKKLKPEDFEAARAIWKRHQKVRALSFPNFQEATPVIGIIYLREAEHWAQQGKKDWARKSFAKAQQHLSQRKPFDLVQQYAFEKLVDQVRKKIK